MRLINKNSKRGIVNLFADFILSKIDKNENFILFSCELKTDKNNRIKTIERKIGFYDLNGEHKYDLNFVNFDEHVTINKEDFERMMSEKASQSSEVSV
jgi:protein-arginine kinase